MEDDEQRTATVDDDEQRSATTPGRAELQIGEQRFRLASFNRRAEVQIGIAFSGKKKKQREKEAPRRRDKENETQIGIAFSGKKKKKKTREKEA